MLNFLINCLVLFAIFFQTDSEVACEEAARLTADIQDENTPEDDDELCEYHDMPPPPDGG